MTHKHNKWLQILAREDFPPKLLWSENADFKFSMNNEGEDVNKKQVEGICMQVRADSTGILVGTYMYIPATKPKQ